MARKSKKEFVDQLVSSRVNRAKIVYKYGELPTSIWIVDNAFNRSISLIADRSKSNIEHAKLEMMRSMPAIDNPVLREAALVSFKGARQGSWSIFPLDITLKLILYYSESGQTILDPFAGHGTRLACSYMLGRNYIGYDVAAPMLKKNREIIDLMKKRDYLKRAKNTATIHNKSSEEIEEPDNSADFIFSSPPYWDVERYSNDKRQLENDGYDGFLKRITNIYRQCYRVLKPGGFIAININNFNKANRYYLYRSDTERCMIEAGFKPWDEIIMVYTNSLSEVFAKRIEESKHVAKKHEYIVVMRKPDAA